MLTWPKQMHKQGMKEETTFHWSRIQPMHFQITPTAMSTVWLPQMATGIYKQAAMDLVASGEHGCFTLFHVTGFPSCCLFSENKIPASHLLHRGQSMWSSARGGEGRMFGKESTTLQKDW